MPRFLLARLPLVLILAIFVVSLHACTHTNSKSLLLLSYTADELKNISDNDTSTKIEPATGGLKVTFPEKGGKVQVFPTIADWSGYDYLVFDVFNHSDQSIDLRFEAADKKRAANRKPLGAYKDRFNDTTTLAPGKNTFRVRVSNAWTCEAHADPVDLKNMAGFILWPSKRPEGVPLTITLSPMRLATADEFPDTILPLFDFEDPAAAAVWTNLDLPDATSASPPVFGDKTHPLKVARTVSYSRKTSTRWQMSLCYMKYEHSDVKSTDYALKITATGGDFPTITTSKLATHDFSPYKSFHATVTATKPSVVIFRAMDATSTRDKNNTRWEKACLLQPGQNQIAEVLSPFTSVTSFEIALYNPDDGDSVIINDIHLSKLWPKETTAYRWRNPCMAGERIPQYPFLDRPWKVLGIDGEFTNPATFAQTFKEKFPTPEKPLSIDDVESAFRAKYDALKKDHPNAVLAIFRQGDKGFDPTAPEKLYESWKDTGIQGHDPPPTYLSGLKGQPRDRSEIFLRRRATLTKVDLSSIPTGSNILAAQFVVVRATNSKMGTNPGLLVAEACNREFVPGETNSIEYAKGKFWQEVVGMHWQGADPDFLSLILAHGPSHLNAIPCDFTNAVKYWTAAPPNQNPNHGFAYYSIYSVHSDFLTAHNSRTKNLKDRPALMVIYEPK
ncbi:MAG: hypothetical protein FWD53_00605 [Phycisphaerales bacterium]|nr:hypothetical protein [Phycisphaerales bacterium]